MKTRALWLFPVVLCGLWGCPAKPGEKKDAGNPAASDAGVADAGVPDASVEEDAGPPLRTVTTDATIFGKTTVNNLLLDPLFGAVFTSGESFFSLEQRGADLGNTYGIPGERATPTGTPSLTVISRSPGYSTLTASLLNGGRGPFYVDAWLALASSDGSTYAGTDVRVRVGEVWLGGTPGVNFELQYIPADDVTINGVTWWHHAATITEDLPATSLMVAEARRADISLMLAGPEVVPESLRNNARGSSRLVPYPARKGRWLSSDKALMEVARHKLPQLGSPPALRREQIRRDIESGKGKPSPVR